MNPELLRAAAQEHGKDLRREAARSRRAAEAANREPIRRKAGWTLVHIGLRLANSARL